MEQEEKQTTQCSTQEHPHLSLWVIAYKIPVNTTCKGIAVIKAFDANEAKRTFLANSVFNGKASKIVIEEMYQVGESFVPMLLAEQYFTDPYNTEDV